MKAKYRFDDGIGKKYRNKFYYNFKEYEYRNKYI